MAWADLPAPVKLAVKPLQGAGEVTDITRTTEGTHITYEIKLRDERGHRALTFNPDGKPAAP